MMHASPVVANGERVHDLQRALDTLYEVGRVLSRSLDLRETMGGMLRAMEQGGLYGGLITLLDDSTGDMVVEVGMGLESRRPIRYRSGEGILGRVVDGDREVVLPVIDDEPDFLNRTGLYDPGGAFIAQPVRTADGLVGVLACQPESCGSTELEEKANLVRMIAQLLGQAVQYDLGNIFDPAYTMVCKVAKRWLPTT